MKKNLALITALSLLLLGSAAFATPSGVPNQFFGTVTINGAPAPDGTIVSAKINGVQVSSTATSGGKYGYSPTIFYVDDPDANRAGSLIQFFVNGVNSGATAYFENFASTELNLAATISTPSGNTQSGGSSSGSSGSGGGGGGSGGGGSGGSASGTTSTGSSATTTTTTTTSGVCRERWLCSEWSACENGIQTRTCNDANKCGTNNNEPMTSQPCAIRSSSSAESGLASQAGAASNLISGLFLSAATPTGVGIIAFVLIAGYLGFNYFSKRRNS